MVCKSICERILLKKYRPGYSDGKKYCSKCEIYLFHEGNFCPCCGVQLRTSPADKKLKEKRKYFKISETKLLAY
jgi:hypothetical protein